ncbi:MAG: hypothetical protein ABEH81_04840 [Halopenitus sp.]
MARLWLVDREFDSKGLVRLTYATEDGEQVYVKEIAEAQLFQRGVTAAVDVDEGKLKSPDTEDVGRFATEASRMASEHDPDDEI